MSLLIDHPKRRQFTIAARQVGLRTAMRRAAWGYLRPHTFVALRKPLQEWTPEIAIDGVRFELWHRNALAAWRERHGPLPVEFFQDQIHGVETCAVACAGSDLAGLIWIYERGDPSRFFVFERATDVELNYGYIREQYRRQGLFRALLTYACNRLHEAGRQNAFAAVHSSNGPSLAAFRAVGFRDVRVFRHFLFFRPRVRVSRRAV